MSQAEPPHPLEQAPPPGAGTPLSRHHPEQAHSPRAGTFPQSRHIPPEQAHSPRAGTPSQIPLNFPLGCGPGPDPLNFPLDYGPGPDPSKFPPWVWAWKPARHAGIPPPWRPAARHAGIPPAMHAGIAPPTPVNRITDACENIALPQLRCGR